MYSKTLGTVEIAKMIGMSRITVHSWVVKGDLKAIRTPGRHFRVKPEDLIEFLKRRGAPVPEELRGIQKIRLVLIGKGASWKTPLSRALRNGSDAEDFEAHVHPDPLAALMDIGDKSPHLVAVAAPLKSVDATDVIRAVRKRFPKTRIIALPSENGDSGEVTRMVDAGADLTLRAPYSVEDVARSVHQLA